MRSLTIPAQSQAAWSFLPRIIRGVDVNKLKWADAVDLDNGFALGPGEVAHLPWHDHERTCRQGLRGVGAELVAFGRHESALDHRDVFIRRMPVRRDLVSIRQLDANH